MKFKRIINTVKGLGFHDFYQAGVPSQFHELNLIIKNPTQDRQYWIGKSLGGYSVTYRCGIDDIRARQYRFNCKTQAEVCSKFRELVTQ